MAKVAVYFVPDHSGDVGNTAFRPPDTAAKCRGLLGRECRHEQAGEADLRASRREHRAVHRQYSNPCRLHSAIGYRPPDEFERQAATGAPATRPAGAIFFQARGGA
jgi:hypothetical protein